MSTTVELDVAMVKAIGMVGRTVTWRDAQYRIHSVEGPTWYAFESAPGVTTVDGGMTPASWISEPIAMILPAGTKIEEGLGVDGVLVSDLERGVCLSKCQASTWAAELGQQHWANGERVRGEVFGQV